MQMFGQFLSLHDDWLSIRVFSAKSSKIFHNFRKTNWETSETLGNSGRTKILEISVRFDKFESIKV